MTEPGQPQTSPYEVLAQAVGAARAAEDRIALRQAFVDYLAVDEPTHAEREPVLQLDVVDAGARIDADAVLALVDHDGPDPALVHSVFSGRTDPHYLVVPEAEPFDAVVVTRNALTARSLVPHPLDLHGLDRDNAARIADHLVRERPLHEMVAHQAWEAAAEALHPGMTARSDWRPLHGALQLAHQAGVDLAAILPELAHRDPLPDDHPARELHFRLLETHPLHQAIDPGPARTAAALDPSAALRPELPAVDLPRGRPSPTL